MVQNSVHILKKIISEVPHGFATIGALVLLALAVNTAQAAPPPPNPQGKVEADGVIAEQIYDALNADPTHYFRHVDVDVRHGIVTLSGFVWSSLSIYRAEQIAAGVPGVTGVVDQMELERDGLIPHA